LSDQKNDPLGARTIYIEWVVFWVKSFSMYFVKKFKSIFSISDLHFTTGKMARFFDAKKGGGENK